MVSLYSSMRTTTDVVRHHVHQCESLSLKLAVVVQIPLDGKFVNSTVANVDDVLISVRLVGSALEVLVELRIFEGRCL